MPISEAEDEEPTKSQSPAHPRRSPAVKYPRNGATNGKAPSPARKKAAGKKPEPTLLGDFLLGRPSADRARRRSSASAPPVEMKVGVVGKLRPPGGVNQRVKQWQKTSAAAVMEDPGTPEKIPDDDGLNGDEDKEKPGVEPPVVVKSEKKKPRSGLPPRARGAPIKRVVSDSHWVKDRTKSSPKKQELLLNLLVDPVAIKKSLAAKADNSKRLPKDFVKSNWANPPLERKIQDWASRTEDLKTVPYNETPEDSADTASRSAVNPSVTEGGSDIKSIKSRRLPKGFVKSTWTNQPLERKMRDWEERGNNNITIPLEEKPEAATEAVTMPPSKPIPLKRSMAGKKNKPKGLPKDFVESHWANPPLERKMQDWVQRIEKPDTIPYEDVADASPKLPESHKPIKKRSRTKLSSPNGSQKDLQESKRPNPSFERRIRDWAERTKTPDIAQDERPKTPKPSRSRIEHRESSESQKDLGKIAAVDIVTPKHKRERPQNQDHILDRKIVYPDMRPRSRDQAKAEPAKKSRSDKSVSSENKSKLGRRGAIHDAVGVAPKKSTSVKRQNSKKRNGHANSQVQSQVDTDRRRKKEEFARKQDRLANNKDPTRARNLRTLAPVSDVQIDQTRQVKAKEYFGLDLKHTNGQRMACEVEFIVRDSDHDAGDVLICEVNAQRSHFLLFQPLLIDQISVRKGDMDDDIIVMARGQQDGLEWRESFLFKAEHPDIVDEFLTMFAHEPVPPAISRFDPQPLGSASPDNTLMSGALICLDAPDVPIGEHAGFQDQNLKETTEAMKTLTVANGHSMSKKRSEDRLSQAKRERNNLLITQTTTVSDRSLSKEPPSVSQTQIYTNQTALKTKTDHRTPRLSSPSSSDTVSTLTSTPRSAAINIDPPQPPPHKEIISRDINKGSRVSHNASYELKSKRPSSPLKHEYNPSHYTSTSSSYLTETDDDDYTSESSSDEEDETEDIASQIQQVNEAVLPGINLQPPEESYCFTFSAHISCWRVPPGRWDDLKSDLCSIVITPGSIEVFALDNSHTLGTEASNNVRPSGRPLLAQVLTPLVLIRQSNYVDVEIHSQPLDVSSLKSTSTVRFRSKTDRDCRALYAAAYKARQDNEKYKRLQREREQREYDKQENEDWGRHERKARYGWFGRKKSYRASGHASSLSGSERSTFSLGAAAFSAFKRMSNGGSHNSVLLSPNRSRFEPGTKSRGSSMYGTSDSAQSSSRRSGTDPSVATTDTARSSVFDTDNLIIRLYQAGTTTPWVEIGPCLITIGAPQPGMRQASSLYNGTPKQVTLTEHIETKQATRLNKHFAGGSAQTDKKEPLVFYHGVLGARCFTRVQQVGIVMNVWEELVGPNGEVGMPGAVGGVSGRQRKWMFHCSNSAQAGWIFALLGGGM